MKSHNSAVIFFVTTKILRNQNLKTASSTGSSITPIKYFAFSPIGQSVDYPVDLYFLFDLSFSMNKSRYTFAEQSKNIISSIKEVTEDYRIGFGSFIDKDVVPFKSNVDEFNCPKDKYHDKCVDPYSFYHQKSLGVINPTEFERLKYYIILL